ncbi:MAG TPA: fatty acid desaturase [Gemmatimonadales bacterium]|nr:fatty acid desaturase [Gemmatimonadales bacterium]
MTVASLEETGPVFVDRKRHLWLLGLVVPALPFIAAGLVRVTGLGLMWWFGPLFVYGVIPFCELAIGLDRDNPPESAVPALEADRFYRRCVYAFIPLQYVSFVWGAWMVAHGGLGWLSALGLTVTVGVMNGIGINTAHELGHKREETERLLAKITLAPVAYGHFYVEHNRGHRVRVATPEDPASSRFGESFYRFWPRTVAGSFRSAWDIEQTRLARMNRGPWSWQSDIVQAFALTALVSGALLAAFGPVMIPFLVIQAVVGFSELEVVNYLEHYGLLRQKTADGRYERATPAHSWNSNQLVTNVFLYQLQRHSDHHAHPTRRYQALRHFEESPQLPSGYASMIVLALVPPLWRRVMDWRVRAHYGGDLGLANIHPALRERVLAAAA